MSIETLVEIIQTERPLKAIQAIRELGGFDDVRAVDILIEVLYSDNALKQQAAADALSSFNNDRVSSALCNALARVSPLVRVQIVKSLERMNRRETIPCLIAALKEAEAESLQYTIIEALGNMNALEARETIQMYLDHSSHHVRKRALMALEKIS